MSKYYLLLKKLFLNLLDCILGFLEDLKHTTFKEIGKTLIFTFTLIIGLIIGVILDTITLDHNIINTVVENTVFQVTYVFLIVVLIAFTIVAIFKNKYKLSYWEFIGFTLLFAIYFGLSHEFLQSFIFEPWGIHIFTPFSVIIPSLFTGLAVNAHWPIEKNNSHNNTFLEDNPLTEKELKEDTTYNHLIEKIAPALFKDVYKSSFSIGVIGPWGTGKSSFLSAVKYAVCETDEKELNEKYNIDLNKKPDTIFIEFSPFLNHKEEQVIHEFFTQLSNQLSERSGRLSNLITVYSEKLANISDVNPWFSLFKIARNSREKRSAQELYDEIKTCISELNLKIIVTVDDLDRLNAKEILQVLKLIRNTSNFPNTVFLVALDKEYVMKTLEKENSYSYRDYVDKFFQLELNISIPEYEEVIVAIINQLENINFIDEEGIFHLSRVLKNGKDTSLFDILKNHRYAKKILNQLIIDYQKIHKLFTEVDPGDYLKFTFLKINFPRFYLKISTHPEYYLDVTEENYSSKQKPSKNNNNEICKFNTKIDLPTGCSDSNISEYYFGEELEVKQEANLYTNDDACLIKKILIEIFDNPSPNTNSVSFTSNFRKIIRFQLDENEINEEEFRMLIIEVSEIKHKIELLRLINKYNLINKIKNLSKRLEWFDNQDKIIHLNLIKLHFSLLSKHQIFNDDKAFYLLLSSLERFLELKEVNNSALEKFRFFTSIEVSKNEIKQILNEFWIENQDVSNIKRFDLILSFKENRFIQSLWDEQEFEDLALILFSQYLSDYLKEEWSVDDFKFFSYLRSIKDYVEHKKIQEVIKEHFESSPIETLCRQIIHADIRASKYFYAISDLIPIMFGSYDDFYDFIKPKIHEKYPDNINFQKFINLLKHFIIINENPVDQNTYYIAETFDGWMDLEEKKLERNINIKQLKIEVFSDKLFEYLHEDTEWINMLNRAQARQVLVKSEKFKSNFLYLTFKPLGQDYIQGIKNIWLICFLTCHYVEKPETINLFEINEVNDDTGEKIYKTISIEPASD